MVVSHRRATRHHRCVSSSPPMVSELSRGGRLHGPRSAADGEVLVKKPKSDFCFASDFGGERTLRAAALRLTPDSIALKPGPDPCTGSGGSLVGRSVEERRLGLVRRGRGRRGATDVERGKNQRGEGVLIRGERTRRHPRRGDGASRRSGRGERGGGGEGGGGGERRRLSGARGRRRRRAGAAAAAASASLGEPPSGANFGGAGFAASGAGFAASGAGFAASGAGFSGAGFEPWVPSKP